MAMANAGAAFGLEDVPDLPEAPTEQPKYNRDYHRLFVKFMSWLHKRTYTKAARFQPSALAGIQPHHVADYLKWRAYGATWNGTSGNPTKSDPVNEVVKEVKKAETQHRGKKSCATRDLTETEYRKVVHELYGKGSFESTIRTACMLKQQVHLITRTDDISKLKYSDYKPHPDFPFALSCKVHWSKNISEERQCPDQIILGSMDTDFCAMLGLANYMEASFNYGYGAAGREDAFLFTPESDPKLAPKHCNAAYRNILKAVFLSAPFLAVALLIASVLGSHSIRKFAATLARGMGATADEVDIRGRWKARLSGRVVDAYISPEQPWIDARVAEKLAWGLYCLQATPDAKRVTPDWLIEHVVPRTHAFYDGVNDISLHLALPLLWAALDESWEERMEPPFVLGSKMRTSASRPIFLLASTLW
ncbi:expressed unknown protein [Seminavis robusta]|uniref:Uncharacterized protein n=1 Tax=Seminavis robusta TaxID=568900 RepID=A0A9N8HTL0_9STRA|nr:expressed unknown protein [Seminavis robusta]|eukprot:Sro1607_g285550.1 n/a (420) ;mRNA; r:2394-3757